MDAPSRSPRLQRWLIIGNAAVTTIIVVLGLWAGTRNPLGYLVVALAIVAFGAAVLRIRKRFAAEPAPARGQ